MKDEQLAYILRAYENKLYDLMRVEDYRKFITETARKAFKVDQLFQHGLENLIEIARRYRSENEKDEPEEDTED